MQPQHHRNEADAYDLERVEARLAAMEAARLQRRAASHRATLGTGGGSVNSDGTGSRTTMAVAQRATTSGLDLLAASSSSDSGSEDDSDDGDGSRGGGGRRGSRWLKDSLDLSMSMSMAEVALSSSNSRAANDGTRSNTARTSTVEPRGVPPVTEAAGAVVSNNYSTSNLIQRRRQLQRELADDTSKEKETALDSSSWPNRRVAHVSESAISPLSKVQTAGDSHRREIASQQVAQSTRAAWVDDSNSRRTPQQRSTYTDRELIAIHNDHTDSSRLSAASGQGATTRSGIPRASSAPAESQRKAISDAEIPKPQQRLAHQYLRKEAPLAPKESIPSNQPRATVEPSSIVRQKEPSHTPISPTIRGNKVPPKERVSTTPSRDDVGQDNQHDEDEQLTLEERQLRQSLDKLDRRLTALAVSAPKSSSRELDRESVRSRDGSVRSSPLSAPSTAENTEQVLRAAAYGGGTHCKPGQITSAASRSSSSKRAELSSGLPKSRVRVGGVTAQEPVAPSTEPAGHKVVVKKNLAHLLFQ